MQIMENKKQKFDGVLFSGLISGIVASSIAILACIGPIIWGIWLIVTGTKLEWMAVELIVFFITLFFIGMIGQFVNLNLTIRFLKGKTDNKRIVTFCNLYVSAIIGIGVITFILILVGTNQQNKIQDSLMLQMEQIDLEYQEYLRDKEENKTNK